MNNQQLIGALAMDLKRVSLGLQRKSSAMAEAFTKEALKRCEEITISEVKPYMAQTIEKTKQLLKNQTTQNAAEDLLMYSTLVQNYFTTNQNNHN